MVKKEWRRLQNYNFWFTNRLPMIRRLYLYFQGKMSDRLPIDERNLKAGGNFILTRWRDDRVHKSKPIAAGCRYSGIFRWDTYEIWGVCDVCISKKKKDNSTTLKDYFDQINYLLGQNDDHWLSLKPQWPPGTRELFKIEAIRELIDAVSILDEVGCIRSKTRTDMILNTAKIPGTNYFESWTLNCECAILQ